MSEETKRPVRLVVDCDTKEQQYIELTDEEIDQMNADRIAKEEREAARAAEEAAIIAARESARTKLAALGLTEAEVAALVK